MKKELNPNSNNRKFQAKVIILPVPARKKHSTIKTLYRQVSLFVTWRCSAFEIKVLWNQTRPNTCFPIKIRTYHENKNIIYLKTHIFSCSQLTKTSSLQMFSLLKWGRPPRLPSEQSHFDDHCFINTLWRLMTKCTPAVLKAYESKALYAGSYLLIFSWLTDGTRRWFTLSRHR